MAYRAEIDIVVQGQQQLNRLQRQIEKLSVAISDANVASIIDPVSPGTVQSIQQYANAISVATTNLREAAIGTKEETDAVKQYVNALGLANSARSRQNSLVAQEIANRRKIKPQDAGFGQQMPALPPRVVEQFKAKESWKKFFVDAAETAEILDQGTRASRLNARTSWNNFFNDAAQVALDLQNALETPAALREKRATAVLETARKRRLAGRTQYGPEGAGPAGTLGAVTSSSAMAASREVEDLVRKQAQQRIEWERKVDGISTSLQKQLNSLRVKHNAALYRLEQRRVRRIAAEEEAAAKESAKRRAKAVPDAMPKRLENVALGAGFPLLFGGGPGAVLGGALGGLTGGFGAQIILSAFGQIIDKFVTAAAEAGAALRKPIEAFEELIRIGGLAGTAVSRQVRVAEFLGVGEVGATGVARAAQSNIGAENVSALVKFATSTERLSNTFAIFDSNLKALLARGLTPVTNALDDFLKGLTGLRGQVEFADVGKLRQLESTVATLEQAGAPSAAITPYREQLKILQEQNAAAQEYKDLQDQIQEIADRVVSNAEAQARYEQDRLGLTRLAAASRQGQLAVDQASLELDKLRVRLTDEVKGAEREILEIMIKQAAARKKQAEAAQANAVEETRRQLERERLQREVQILNLKDQTRSVIVNQSKFEHGLLATYDSQEQALRMSYKNKLDALELERRSALIGVNDLDVQKEINAVYQYRGLLLRQQSKFALRQLEAAGASAAIGEARFGNQLQQQRLEARGRAASAIQAADLTPGLTAFFGGSEKLKQQQIIDFNIQLANMNNQLRNTEDIINSIDFQKLSFNEQQGLQRQAENLRDNIAAFKEYQPAIDRAALLQQNFEDALRFTQPAIQATAKMLEDFTDTAVTGNEAVANALRSFAQILMQEAVRIIATYIAIGIAKSFANGGAFSAFSASGSALAQFNASAAKYRANGGPVSAGSPYVVGEKGPELFVPGKSGTIVPNSSLGGADVVVNVDASGSKAQGNQADASALGRAIGAAVQAELVKQKRPGGLLA